MRKILFYTISWFLVILSLPLLAVALLIDKLGNPEKAIAFTEAFLARLAKILLFLTGSTVEIKGLENLPKDEPVLFVSNHQGHFDSAVLLAHVQVAKSFIATSKATEIPILKHWFNLGRVIYFEKDNIRQNYEAMQGAMEILRSGRSVVIYPEGIISQSPEQGEFKRGAFKPAFITGVPIVPIAIDGTWQIMGQDNETIQPAKIVLEILPPIPTAGISRQEQLQLPAKVASLIKAKNGHALKHCS